MARNHADREDILAEAVALTPRVELLLTPEQSLVVAGRRAGGRWSIYFDQDPVYHFEPTGGLRRAYVADKLYRSEGNTLAELTRERTEISSSLLRTDLSPEACAAFLRQMRQRLEDLSLHLTLGQAEILRQVPSEPDCRPELTTILDVILNTPTPLAAPLK